VLPTGKILKSGRPGIFSNFTGPFKIQRFRFHNVVEKPVDSMPDVFIHGGIVCSNNHFSHRHGFHHGHSDPFMGTWQENDIGLCNCFIIILLPVKPVCDSDVIFFHLLVWGQDCFVPDRIEGNVQMKFFKSSVFNEFFYVRPGNVICPLPEESTEGIKIILSVLQ